MTRRRGESTKAYINRWHKEYKKLTPVYSKLINGTINFTSRGFNHLVYANAHRRPLKVIEDRLPYIPRIQEVILNQPILLAPRREIITIYGRKREVLYYTFMNSIRTKNGDSITLKVVVRKVGERGSFTFQSVMKKKIQKKQKSP